MPPSEPLLPVQGRSRARNLLPPILLLGMLGLVAVCLLLGKDPPSFCHWRSAIPTLAADTLRVHSQERTFAALQRSDLQWRRLMELT